MKNKTKLMVVASAFLIGAVAASTTATLAWFGSTQTASVSFAQGTIVNRDGDLLVKAAAAKDGAENVDGRISLSTADYASTVAISNTADIEMTDVSSDGKLFLRPNWKPDSLTNYNSIKEVKNSYAAGGKTYYFEFKFSVKNSGTEPFDVALNSETALSPVGAADAEDIAAVKATRVAILDDTATNLITYWHQDATITATKYLKAADAAAGTINEDSYGDASALTGYHQGTWTALEAKPTSYVAGQKLVGDLAGGAEKTFTIRMWLEGTYTADPTVKDGAAIGGLVKFNLDLVALR